MSLSRLSFTAAAILVAASPAAADGYVQFVGQVITVPYDFCPEGWTDMHGQQLAITEYPDLYAVLGNAYGGDGDLTFALPTGTPVMTTKGVPLRQCIALQGDVPSRSQ
jgi:hypothetical protein